MKGSGWSTRLAGVVAIAIAAAQAGAQGQAAVITGKVTGEADRPLGGANVYISELNAGANTRVDGTYSLTVAAGRANGQTLMLRVRFLGHTPSSRQIVLSGGAQVQDFKLVPDPVKLSEVVVTGTADVMEKKKLAFAVGTVSADQLKDVPATNALGGLTGKVAGARVLQAGGDPGSAPSIRLRSGTSLTGTQDPLIIIDGTITRATLADVNSEDIERIEVIKGAAASSLYGSDAANGVVQIFTKRGANQAEGQQIVTFRTEGGRSFQPKDIKQSGAHAFKVDAAGNYVRTNCGAANPATCPRISEPDGIADNAYLNPHDHLKEVLQSGQFLTSYLSIGQKIGATNYNASFQHNRNEGIIKELKGYTRENVRLNIDRGVNDKLDMSVGTFFGKSNNQNTAQGPGSPFFAVTFVEPDVDLLAKNPDGSPYAAKIPDRISNASNPLYALHNQQNTADRTRFTGTGKLRYRVMDWLTAEGNYNYDQENQGLKNLTPRGFLDANGVAGSGRLSQDNINGRTINTGATLTSIRTYKDWFTNTTKAAYIFESQYNAQVVTTTGSLTVPGTPEFSAGDQSQLTAGSQTITIRNRNTFLISTFDIKDKFIVDGLVRRDESSLFGKDNRSANYYRASAAYRVSQDFTLPGVDEFRLRISQGTAGLRPVFDAQYESFSVAGGSPVKVTLGNKDLKPALSTETEMGFNLDFLKRYSLEYTYSNKTTKDQIMLVPLSAATGYQNQWKNAGTLAGKTHELALGALIATSPTFSWRASVTGDRTRQKITQLNVAPFLTGPSYAGNDDVTQIFRIAAGQPFGVMYGEKFIRNIDQLYDDPAKKAASGAGQTWSRDSVIVNEEGFVVRKSAYHTISEAALKYVAPNGDTHVQIGDVNPDFNLSLNNNMQFHGLAVNTVFDWAKGGNIYNGTRQWPFFENRDRVYDQRGKPEAAKKPQQYYNTFYNSINPNSYFVEDGSYVKLKELSVNYTVPMGIVNRLKFGGVSSARIGVVGRNILTWTKYSGLDPEVAGLSGDPYSFRFDGFSYPNFRTFTAVIELGF